jgi:glutamate racemase
LLEDELRSAFPGVAYVDGGPGIARRIAFLTRGQPWPDAAPEGIAVFNGDGHRPLGSFLRQFGLSEILSM